MKILVTGATGFVGHHVVNWLVDNNYEVIASGTDTNKASQYPWFKDVKFIPCDYFKENHNYYDFFGKPDVLIHLSWKGLPNYMDRFHIEENLPAEMRLLKSFAESKHTKIVVTGTCYEYGLVNGCIAEDHPTNPVTVYGLAKDTLRRYLEFLSKDYGISWNWIRLFYLYGEGQNPKSLLSQLNAAIVRGDKEFPMSGGEQLRDYLPVEKVAEYICRIALSSENGVVNCCSGNMISVRRLVEENIAMLGANIRLKLGVYSYPTYEGMAFCGDNRLLNEVLQYDA